MQTITEAIQDVIKAAEAAQHEVRFCEKHIVGKVACRQGDIYLHMVADDHPHGDKIQSRQLAVGTTMGSRHTIEGASVKIYEGTTLPSCIEDDRTPLGPCFVIDDRETNAHPEHAHTSLAPGKYQITHQMDARTWGRVVD